ncbi:hypothetical protein J4E91_005102 [Alternaria rosae]|nr:hypothetical protein J4E91_005102 [Alternaria rosae]
MARVLAGRIPDEVWDSHKLAIGELYIGEDRKLCGSEGVMDIMMRRYGFSPTKSQYESKIASWGMRKKITDKEWNAILPRVQEREERGRQTHVTFNGILVDGKRIGRELDRRRSNSSMRQSSLKDPGMPPGFEIGSPPPTTDASTDTVMMDITPPSVQFIAKVAKDTHSVLSRKRGHEEVPAQSDFYGLAEVPAANNIPPASRRLDNFSLGLLATDSEVQSHHRDPVTFEMVQSSFDIQDEAALLSNFPCCGLILVSLHDLLEHFETTHAFQEESSRDTPFHPGQYPR